MKKPILIYGAGGLGREVASLIRAIAGWDLIGFIDDTLATGTVVAGVQVKGNISFLSTLTARTSMVIALGDPVAKAAARERISHPLVEFPVLVHPSAIVQEFDSVRIGAGSVICAGSVLTTGIELGEHVLINLNTTIGHNVTIGNNSSVMPGVNIAGDVSVGSTVLIGAGANIRNRVRIGDHSTIGMGAAVIRDVANGDTVAGVPAKSIKP